MFLITPKIPLCSCNNQLHTVTIDQVYEYYSKILIIRDIPLVTCASPDCNEADYFTEDTLRKQNILIEQFKEQAKKGFAPKEMMVSFPEPLLSVRK